MGREEQQDAEGAIDAPLIHPNALKHLSAEEVMEAWSSVIDSVERESDDEPPRWLMIGWLRDGRSVEIVAVEITVGWLIIHANTPIQKKFFDEIERVKRRIR